jgi:hypothetical protein
MYGAPGTGANQRQLDSCVVPFHYNPFMTNDQQLLQSILREWKSNTDRLEKFFADLGDAQLDQEVAPGRNRLIYLLGHMVSVHDRMLPLLGIGTRMHEDLDATFLSSPDRAVATLPPAAELKRKLAEVNDVLWKAFNAWSPADWVARHTAVSEEEFAKEPYRNRLSVLLSRTSHMATHYGQMILVKPRGGA